MGRRTPQAGWAQPGPTRHGDHAALSAPPRGAGGCRVAPGAGRALGPGDGGRGRSGRSARTPPARARCLPPRSPLRRACAARPALQAERGGSAPHGRSPPAPRGPAGPPLTPTPFPTHQAPSPPAPRSSPRAPVGRPLAAAGPGSAALCWTKRKAQPQAGQHPIPQEPSRDTGNRNSGRLPEGEVVAACTDLRRKGLVVH